MEMGFNGEVREESLENRELKDEQTGSMKERINVGKAENELATNWRKLFAASGDQSLKYYPPEESEGKVRVALPKEVIEEGELKWKNAIVAQFVGRIPNFSAFQKLVNML